MSSLFENNGAEFSGCRRYRYALWRIWDTSKPLVMFIGLNPSTANESSDDPTIRRVKSMARAWGYGGVYMMNLFTYVTPNPDELKRCDDPVGAADLFLSRIAERCQTVVFAWGNFPEATERAKAVIAQFPDALSLVQNKNGSPRHPLYVPASVEPMPFKA